MSVQPSLTLPRSSCLLGQDRPPTRESTTTSSISEGACWQTACRPACHHRTWHATKNQTHLSLDAANVFGCSLPYQQARLFLASPASSVVPCLTSKLGCSLPHQQARLFLASPASSVVPCLTSKLGGPHTRFPRYNLPCLYAPRPLNLLLWSLIPVCRRQTTRPAKAHTT